MKKTAAALLLFLGLFGFYLSGAAPSITTGDSGEFITAAATLSLPHAPSFPAYMLAAKCFISTVPFGSVPYRCNVFSAFTSALAGVFFFLVMSVAGAGMLMPLLTALLIGVSASFWENSLVTEVFSLNALFMAGLLLCVVKRQYALFAFLFGLGMGNHQILLFITPAALVSLMIRHPGESRPSRDVPANDHSGTVRDPGLKHQEKAWAPAFAGVTVMGGLFLLGLSVYLVLPIRSMKQPPLNWGQPTTVHKLTRTITRADYGSLKLTVGESQKRTTANSIKHVTTFGKHAAKEIPWPVALAALFALAWGIWKRDNFSIGLTALFLASGPFFFWLGNLPFNAQSDGIVGRFMMMPVAALLMALPLVFRERPRIGAAVLGVALLFTIQRNYAEASAYRSNFLALDYGRGMLRAMPANTTLFMDGGDDAFYSTAMLQNVMGKRPDVTLHDRGGLVFRNPYGPDFRSLPREQKAARRAEVERAALARGPVFFSTMDMNVLPGIKTTQRGYLVEATPPLTPPLAGRGTQKGLVPLPNGEGVGVGWHAVLLRSLYPLKPNVYRMRALGAFFPFMRGRQYLAAGNLDEALRFYRRAGQLGHDVDWLQINLGSDYARAAYDNLMKNRFKEAERIYLQWLVFDPGSFQAHSNLGVVMERTGRIEAAKAQYEKTAAMFPNEHDPLFNLSVLAWKEADWPRVVTYLEEVVRRKPEHMQAHGYLKVAREKMGQR